MDLNIWYYTLSTSAQTLAALAGLFAVFAVWKMQDSEKILTEARLAIIDLVSYISANTRDYVTQPREVLHTASDSCILSIFSELLDIKKNEPDRVTVGQDIRGDSLISYTLNDFTKNLYEGQINKKLDILKRLKTILVWNFAVISACVLSLTFSEYICSKVFLLPIVSVGVLYCLFLVGRGIYVITAE